MERLLLLRPWFWLCSAILGGLDLVGALPAVNCSSETSDTPTGTPSYLVWGAASCIVPPLELGDEVIDVTRHPLWIWSPLILFIRRSRLILSAAGLCLLRICSDTQSQKAGDRLRSTYVIAILESLSHSAPRVHVLTSTASIKTPRTCSNCLLT